MPTLDELRTELIAHWRRAFERVDEITADPPADADVVYTRYPAYALEGYSPKKFKPGARVSRAPHPDGDDYVFHLDAERRPTHVRFAHRINGVDWRGIYRYARDHVEHIEVCIQTGIPSLYNRLTLEGSAVLAEQRFVCNSGGSDERLDGLAAREKADAILADPHAYFIYLTLYRLEDGLPISADEFHEASGRTHRPTREYVYSAGKLQRIIQRWPGGEERTLYKRKG